jgi:hypothetical protein
MTSNNIWYTPERDGDLEAYLKEHDGISCFPLFKGYAHYKLLWDQEYFIPNISIVRLMYCYIRDDEHYIVTGEFELRGIESSRHGGRAGTHDPRVLLEGDAPPWEAQDIGR